MRPIHAKDELPVMALASAKEWGRWLAGSHARSSGVWLRFFKKDSGTASVSHAEALAIALCYGWIDGQKDRFDGDYWLQRFTPRRPRSPWSRLNCDRVAALDAGALWRAVILCGRQF